MADLASKTVEELRALGTPQAWDELVRRLVQAQAQVLARRREQLREALPGALAWALWEAKTYHRSVLTNRCTP